MTTVVTSPPDLRGRTEQGARLARVVVRLAEMDPVGAEPFGQPHAVVDDERDVMIGADLLQRLGEAGKAVFVDILDAQLERRDRPAAERRLEPVGKRAADILRADQIELARLGALGRLEARQVGIIFVHGALISEAGWIVQ